MKRVLIIALTLLVLGCEAKKEPEKLQSNPLKDYVETPLNSAKELKMRVEESEKANLLDDSEEAEEKDDQELE